MNGLGTKLHWFHENHAKMHSASHHNSGQVLTVFDLHHSRNPASLVYSQRSHNLTIFPYDSIGYWCGQSPKIFPLLRNYGKLGIVASIVDLVSLSCLVSKMTCSSQIFGILIALSYTEQLAN